MIEFLINSKYGKICSSKLNEIGELKIAYSWEQIKAAEIHRSGESYSRFAKRRFLYLSQVVNLKCCSLIFSSKLYIFWNHYTTKINSISSKKLKSTGRKQKTSPIQRKLNYTLSSDGENSCSVRLTGMDEVSDYDVVTEVCYTVLISTLL